MVCVQTTDDFKNQFKDKNVEKFDYTKTGATADDEIDALSGATITTNAMTNGVNAGLAAFRMRKGEPVMKQNTPAERLYNGIIKENPTFVLMLGMCPTLAITTSAINGIGMGLTTTVILAASNLMISLLRETLFRTVCVCLPIS